MKKYPKIFVILTSLFLFTAALCESLDDGIPFTCEDELRSLTELKLIIEQLVNESVCNETTECRTIAFGSKPCGGPWSYLVYSTSIDTIQLQEMVEDYNAIEADYNTRCGGASDCMFVTEPTELDCVDGKCIVVN